jgi:hypothetical protein
VGRSRYLALLAGSEVRDRMRIDWDVRVEMDDGVGLSADVSVPMTTSPIRSSTGPRQDLNLQPTVNQEVTVSPLRRAAW